MIAAVHPETISESLSDAQALAGVSVKTTDDLGSDSGTVREADVLIVELGLAPLRQLREVARGRPAGLLVDQVLGVQQVVLREVAGIDSNPQVFAGGAVLGDGRVATDDPVLRQKLARTYLAGELLKLISDRAISAELHGRAMGPEGSIVKLLWSETEQRTVEVASDVLGPDALGGPWARDRVYSRALTIAGGTTHVNKNTVAQRILGLPRG